MAALRYSTRIADRFLLRTRVASPFASIATTTTTTTTPAAATTWSLSPICSARFYSSGREGEPPLLQKIRSDLKTAMRSKDTPRLNVIRSLLAEVVNREKAGSPVRSDRQMAKLLRKEHEHVVPAAEEFRAAGRDDLYEKEMAQARILEEYLAAAAEAEKGEGGAGGDGISDEQLSAIAATAVEASPAANVGAVMGALLVEGGPLHGQTYDKGKLHRIVKQLVEQKGSS